jgi:hypothetical protein
MKTFTAGHVTVEVQDDALEFEGKPGLDAALMTGSAQVARMSTPDGFDALIGVVTWPTGEVDVRVVHFQSGAEPYKRLEKAGTMNLKVVEGTWVARIRALKVNGKDWATLNRVSWEELDWLAGADFKAAAQAHGANQLGTYGELSPTAGKAQANDLALTCKAGDVEAIAYLYAITRPEAIMQQFGIKGPKAVG